MKSLATLENRVHKLQTEIDGPRRVISVITEEGSDSYLLNGRALTWIELEAMSENGRHLLVIHTIPAGYLGDI